MGHGPEMDAIVEPASPLIQEKSESKYRPILYKDYIRGQQSTVKRGKTALHEIMTSADNNKEDQIWEVEFVDSQIRLYQINNIKL